MRPFPVFAFLWALAALLDLAPTGHWDRSPAHTAVALAALAVLARPDMRLFLGLLCGARLVVFGVDSPNTANHQVLYALADAAILVAFVPTAWHEGLRGASGEAWRERFAPVLRLMLLLLYGFAVLHKLNWDYLYPPVSCATRLPATLLPAALGTALAEHAGELLVWGSLALEAALPVLLAVRRTRRVALVAGVLFHGVLGIRFFAFSTGVLALYSLFVPEAVFAGADAARVRRFGSGDDGFTGRLVFGWALLLVVGWGWAGTSLRGAEELAPLARPFWLALLSAVWLVGVFAGLALMLRGRETQGAWDRPAAGTLRASPALLVFPALLVLNGMSPYLGLRTAPTFSMFSNLRTEGGITNHLFLPVALQVADYQRDLVTILETDDPELRRFGRRLRTFYDLKRRVQKLAAAGKTKISLVYRRGQRRVTLSHAERNAELMEPIPWWERKWLRFRPISIRRRHECSW